ncbi:MAG: hypothetical protein FWF06_01625 [Symbiobacteriaceae bacterium]|nr:hypothetical protein [Symbiobacteriaceae bacterium]
MPNRYRILSIGNTPPHRQTAKEEGAAPSGTGKRRIPRRHRLNAFWPFTAMSGVKLSLALLKRILLHALRLIRNSLVWALFALCSVGLALTMLTAQAPWNLILGQPPSNDLTARVVWFNEDQQYGLDQLVAVADDGSILAMQLSATTGNALAIDSRGDPHKSYNVIFREYTSFLWADNYSSVWLHRGNKLLQKLDFEGNLLWQRQLDFWAEAGWCSRDGYILVLVIESPLNQLLILYSPSGAEVWTYSLNNATLISAAVASRGSGVALSLLSYNTATPTSLAHLLDQHGKLVMVGNLGEGTPRVTAISQDGVVAAVGNNYKIVLLINKPGMAPGEILLRSELTVLALGARGKVLTTAASLEGGIGRDRNRNEIVTYSLSSEGEALSAEPLRTYHLGEEVISLEVSQDETTVFITTSEWLRVFTTTGEARWGIEEKDIGAKLVQTVVAPQGAIVGILDEKMRMSIWKDPE